MISIALDSKGNVPQSSTVSTSITATIIPASSPLLVGQSLAETDNWAVFKMASNYATTAPGESIASVVFDYVGTTSNESQALSDGDLNAFSVTVTDTGGNARTFDVQPRTVVYEAPAPAGGLADQILARDVALSSLDITPAFTGDGLSYALGPGSNPLPGGLILSPAGTLSGTPRSASGAASIDLRATNSGGFADNTFALTVIAYAVSVSGLSANPTHGLCAQIGTPLNGIIDNPIGGESITHRWTRDGVVITGAASSSYTPVPADDLALLRYAPDINGAQPASTPYSVRHAPPGAGTLSPVVQTQGSGTATVDLTSGFTGLDMTYTQPASWASISGSILTIADEIRTDTLTITASNSGGSASVDLVVNISQTATTPATISSVTVGPLAGPTLPITISAPTAVNGDIVYWVLIPASQITPTAAEISNAQAFGGTSPTESGSVVWPGPFNDTLTAGIARDSYTLCVVIDNGALSNVGLSAPITIDTTAPVLSGPVAALNGENLDWGVTTDQGEGTIYAALRTALDNPMSVTDIINGTGAALTSDSITAPTAGSGNTGMFPKPTDGTYVIDFVQVNDFGSASSVLSSADVVISSGLTVAYQGNSGLYKNVGTPLQIDMTGVPAGEWLVIGVTQASGGGVDLLFDEMLVEGSGATLMGQVVNTYRKAALFKIACPAAAAGNAAANFIGGVVTDDLTGRYNVFVYTCSSEPALAQALKTDAATKSLDVSFADTTAGNTVVLFTANASTTLNITAGVTEDSTALGAASRLHKSGSAGGISGGARAITISAGSGNSVALAAELGVA